MMVYGLESLVLIFLCLSHSVQAWTSYISSFVDPDLILAGQFGSNTRQSQKTIQRWALQLAAKGPWTVINKPVVPPSGDRRDYMSWAPYYWADCSQVHNTTPIPPELQWTTCPYVHRPGMVNPDVRLLNDSHDFQSLSDGIFYNAMAWAVSGRPTALYANNAVQFLKTWFIDPPTRMNPNLKYARMHRGPLGMIGGYTGILDLKYFCKILSGVLILRRGQCPLWTPDLDFQFNRWVMDFIQWVESYTATLSLKPLRANAFARDHGTYYYGQLAALKILIGDLGGAKAALDTYFTQVFVTQIDASGEQPLQAGSERPFHNRNYNLAGMITNARLARYIEPSSNPWAIQTNANSTIQTAIDFMMGLPPNSIEERAHANELYPNIAAVASAYGDPTGKYSFYLRERDPLFAKQAYFLWDQPLQGGDPVKVTPVVNNSAHGRIKVNHGYIIGFLFITFALVFL